MATAPVDENILRKHFGFNDPNVIQGILNDPGQRSRYEREYGGILSPQPQTQPMGDFQIQQDQKRKVFTDKLGQVPTQLEAVRQELGLPQAFEGLSAAQQAAQGVSNLIEDLPGAIQQQAQGYDVNANQLARMQAAELQKLQPTQRDAARTLQSAAQNLGNLLQQYQVQTGQIFTPLEIEAGVLGQDMAQALDLYKTNLAANLDRELAQLQSANSLQLQQLQNSGALERLEKQAQLEEALSQSNPNIKLQSLGDRLGVFENGQLVSEIPFGVAPTSGGSTNDGW